MTTADERFTALVERTRVSLLCYALRRVSRPADAADIVADTYLVAWRRLERVPEGDAAAAWLFGVARRVLANHHRSERRQQSLADRLRDELAHVQLPAPVETEVTAALATLSRTDQEVLRLTAWEGLDDQALAIALGIRPGAARVRLHRARTRLAGALGRTQPTTDTSAFSTPEVNP